MSSGHLKLWRTSPTSCAPLATVSTTAGDAVTTQITETSLADADRPVQTTCSCHSIREGTDGLSYSYAILGVCCPDCESFSAECDFVDWWNGLTRKERIAELTAATEVTSSPAASPDTTELPF